MNKPEFTPGPWKVVMPEKYKTNIESETEHGLRFTICSVLLRGTPGMIAANARLIAKAPEMFSLLERLSHVELPTLAKTEIDFLLRKITNQ